MFAYVGYFLLDPTIAEASLTFAWCTWLSSWCVKMVRSRELMGFLVIFMVCRDISSWYVDMIFFMVCGDGCILSTNGVLGKGVVYYFICHVILGVRMVSLLCHGILLIRV